MRRTGGIALLALALGIGGALGAGALEAELVYVLGDVEVRRRGAPQEAEIGMLLGSGDVMETGADGMAILHVPGRADLKLREDTVLALDSLGQDLTVSLSRGGVFSRVLAGLTGRYRVVTQTAVAGVRGTEFFVAYGRSIDEYPDLWLCVNSGSVEVVIPDRGESVLVEQGKGINIVGGVRLTRPRAYPWTRRLNWNTDPGQGEVIDRTNLGQAYSDLLDQDYD